MIIHKDLVERIHRTLRRVGMKQVLIPDIVEAVWSAEKLIYPDLRRRRKDLFVTQHLLNANSAGLHTVLGNMEYPFISVSIVSSSTAPVTPGTIQYRHINHQDYVSGDTYVYYAYNDMVHFTPVRGSGEYFLIVAYAQPARPTWGKFADNGTTPNVVLDADERLQFGRLYGTRIVLGDDPYKTVHNIVTVDHSSGTLKVVLSGSPSNDHIASGDEWTSVSLIPDEFSMILEYLAEGVLGYHNRAIQGMAEMERKNLSRHPGHHVSKARFRDY